MDIKRRQLLKSLPALGAVTAVSGLAFPSLSFGQVESPNKIVWIALRGAMDGLNVVIPHGDKDYAGLRPTLAIPKTESLPITSYFSLHPELKNCQQWFENKEMSFVHACSTSYRSRSHFDAQKILENGTDNPFNHSGWLNRLLDEMGGKMSGIAIDSGLPLVLQGEEQVQSWYPNRLKTRDKQEELLELMFEGDPMLSQNYQSVLGLQQILGTEKVSKQFASLMGKAGELLAMPTGPNVAALELNGWDTHANQAQRLKQQLKTLDSGLAALKSNLKQVWENTLVIAASEFGRTAHENGTKGTDHGTGNVMFLAGGAIKARGQGGKVEGDWPGLSKSSLYQGRDLKPTSNTHQVIGELLKLHINVTDKQLKNVFPNI